MTDEPPRPRYYRIEAEDQTGKDTRPPRLRGRDKRARWTKRGFTGLFVVELGFVVRAEGPVSWAIGKTFDDIEIICRKNGWTLRETPQ